MIVDCLIKMIHYMPVKIMINTSGQAKVSIDVVVCHHSICKLTITDYGLFFISKF